MDQWLIIPAALATQILIITQGIKKALESGVLVWILKLTGHSEVEPWVAVGISIVTALVAGFVAYGPDGITISEGLKILTALVASWGMHGTVKSIGGGSGK